MSNGKTPWANIIAGVSVVLLIIAGFVNAYVRETSRLERDIDGLVEAVHSHVASPGHFGVVANEKALARLEKAIEDLRKEIKLHIVELRKAK